MRVVYAAYVYMQIYICVYARCVCRGCIYANRERERDVYMRVVYVAYVYLDTYM